MTNTADRPPVGVLLVEDEESHRADWVEKIEKQFPSGVEIREADSFDGVVEVLESGFHPDIAVIDHRLRASESVEAANGDHVARWLRGRCPTVRILVTTGFSMERLRGGRVYEAYHEIGPDILLFEKDSNWVEDVFPVLERLVNEVRGILPEVVRVLQSELVATSPAMKAFVRAIAPYARRHCPLLLLGETGVGKGFVAEAMNRVSAPSGAKAPPFFKVTCTAVNANLAESELFGHAKGAFTGASRDRTGFFEEAGEGTIFLDEIGHVPLEFQAKLLEVLQTGMYRRVGEDRERKTNARIVAATNADLRKRIAEGTFREDLYYRLSVAEFRVPALRERREDIVPLATLHLKQKHPGYTLARASKDVLERFNWPGNIRELENHIKRAVASSESRQLGPHLFLALRGGAAAGDPVEAGDTTQPAKVPLPPSDWHSELDMDRVRATARDVWTTRGGCIHHDPEEIGTKHGYPVLRAVLALVYEALNRDFARAPSRTVNQRKKDGVRAIKRPEALCLFNELFGFGDQVVGAEGFTRPSENASLYFKTLPTEFFPPDPASTAGKYTMASLKRDARTLREAGFRLDLS